MLPSERQFSWMWHCSDLTVRIAKSVSMFSFLRVLLLITYVFLIPSEVLAKDDTAVWNQLAERLSGDIAAIRAFHTLSNSPDVTIAALYDQAFALEDRLSRSLVMYSTRPIEPDPTQRQLIDSMINHLTDYRDALRIYWQNMYTMSGSIVDSAINSMNASWQGFQSDVEAGAVLASSQANSAGEPVAGPYAVAMFWLAAICTGTLVLCRLWRKRLSTQIVQDAIRHEDGLAAQALIKTLKVETVMRMAILPSILGWFAYCAASFDWASWIKWISFIGFAIAAALLLIRIAAFLWGPPEIQSALIPERVRIDVRRRFGIPEPRPRAQGSARIVNVYDYTPADFEE